jgi:Zn finger protein HypA/HybF involved in hydrogenase expression
MKIEVAQLQCLRCGHKWAPRTDDVRTCPKCRSVFWDTPRKTKKCSIAKQS